MIPEMYQQLAQELTVIAKKYKLHSLSGNIRPGFYGGDFRDTIEYQWSEGRHGAEERQIYLTSTHRMTVKLNEKPPKSKDGKRDEQRPPDEDCESSKC